MTESERKPGNPLFGKVYKGNKNIEDSSGPAETLGIRLPYGTKEKLKAKFGSKYVVQVRKAIADLLNSEALLQADQEDQE